jgi:putative redox protein
LRATRGAPAILIGHSLGGAAALAGAHRIPDVHAVVTIAAPCDPVHVTGLFKERIDKIRGQGEVEVMLAGRPFRIKREFLDDIAEQNIKNCLANLRKALLVFIRPPTISSELKTPRVSSLQPSIPKVSYRLPVTIIC